MAELAPPMARPAIFDAISRRGLIWMPEEGVGYLDIANPSAAYDRAYFERYLSYEGTRMSAALISSRVALVERHWDGDLIDVGIGAGTFLTKRNDYMARTCTFGTDVNRIGVGWLIQRNLLRSPYAGCEAVSLWDVLEHIQDFDRLLAAVSERVFCCLPIFSGPDDILRSRHFRRDQHFWYFTEAGFIRTMAYLGWSVLEINQEESLAGRDSIRSYAFARR